MKEVYEKDYLFKVWILSLCLAPVILITIVFLSSNNSEFDLPSLIGFTFFTITFSLVLSIPTLIIAWLVYRYISSKQKGELFIKCIVSITSIIGVLVTFYIILGKETMLSEDIIFPAAYCISIAACAFLCRLEKKNIQD